MTLHSRLPWIVLAGLLLTVAAGAVVLQEKELPTDEDALWQYSMNQYNEGHWQEGERAFKRYFELFPKIFSETSEQFNTAVKELNQFKSQLEEFAEQHRFAFAREEEAAV